MTALAIFGCTESHSEAIEQEFTGPRFRLLRPLGGFHQTLCRGGSALSAGAGKSGPNGCHAPRVVIRACKRIPQFWGTTCYVSSPGGVARIVTTGTIR